MYGDTFPPAVKKLPPAYRLLPDTVSADTTPSIPDPSADQLVPFHLAMLVAEMPPAVVKPPPRIHVAARHRQRRHIGIIATHARTQRGPTAPVPFGDPVGNHISDDAELAADVNIARAIHHRRVNMAVRAGNAAHADPVGIAEGRVNAHGIHRLCIIHHYDQSTVWSPGFS